jgi:N utilization substance protein B
MSLPPQKFREIVFQLLYSYDSSRATEEEMTPLIMAELSVTKKSVRMATERTKQILTHLPEIDLAIRKASLSYEFERILSVERNILRLAVFELQHDSTMPPKVAIAEAIRLARKFSTPEAAAFINAILDNLYKSTIGERVDAQRLSETIQNLKQSEDMAQEASKKGFTTPEGIDETDSPV